MYIIRNKILRADSTMDGEREKSRMKEATNESASLISSLNLGSVELLIEKICAIGKRGNRKCRVFHD